MQSKDLNTCTSTCTCMVSKNITITEDAYGFLKRLKSNHASFSEVILSLKEKRNNIMSYAGSMKNVDLSSIEKIRKEARKDWENRNDRSGY